MMTKFTDMKGIFGLLPTPYKEDLEIHTADLKKVASFCCESGQHGIVWPVRVGEFWFLGEEERIRGLDAVLEEVNGRLPVVFGCSGISVPQVLLYARAAQKAGVDSIIAMGEYDRRTKRSPTLGTTGVSSRIWATASAPGGSSSQSRRTMRARSSDDAR